MSSIGSATAAVTTPQMTKWMPGPVDPHDAHVVVSVTEFAARHRLDLPGIAVKGLRMRMGWYAMPGAVGMWLWAVPAPVRSGSVSVWASDEDLERFITLPHHVDIMRRYGDRGTVRSTTWREERLDRTAILQRARTWIMEESS